MKLFRYSGQPIDPLHAALKRAEQNSKMDLLESSIGKCTRDNAHLFEAALHEFDDHLLDTYPLFVEIEYPASEADYKELNEQWGTIAFAVEDEEIVGYVIDGDPT